jgi:hypothetical protein
VLRHCAQRVTSPIAHLPQLGWEQEPKAFKGHLFDATFFLEPHTDVSRIGIEHRTRTLDGRLTIWKPREMESEYGSLTKAKPLLRNVRPHGPGYGRGRLVEEFSASSNVKQPGGMFHKILPITVTTIADWLSRAKNRALATSPAKHGNQTAQQSHL